MSDITDWEPELVLPNRMKHSSQFEYSAFEYRQFIKELEDKLENAELVIAKNQEQIKQLNNCNEFDRKQLTERFERLKRIAIIGLEACFLILSAICEANTSHWQKKENLRNAMGVLQTLQKRIAQADATPLPFDDDF